MRSHSFEFTSIPQRINTMKTWNKPAMTAVEAGFEVTRYMPAEIGTCKGKK